MYNRGVMIDKIKLVFVKLAGKIIDFVSWLIKKI